MRTTNATEEAATAPRRPRPRVDSLPAEGDLLVSSAGCSRPSLPSAAAAAAALLLEAVPPCPASPNTCTVPCAATATPLWEPDHSKRPARQRATCGVVAASVVPSKALGLAPYRWWLPATRRRTKSTARTLPHGLRPCAAPARSAMQASDPRLTSAEPVSQAIGMEGRLSCTCPCTRGCRRKSRPRQIARQELCTLRGVKHADDGALVRRRCEAGACADIGSPPARSTHTALQTRPSRLIPRSKA